MKVSEIFYSIQGEGASTGTPAIFIRLSDCNLRCGKKGSWECDTLKLLGTGKEMTPDEVITALYELDPFLDNIRNKRTHLVITGGEPLLEKYQQDLIELLDMIGTHYTEVETNGTIFPVKNILGRCSQINCSPKLSSAGHNTLVSIKGDILKKMDTQFNTYFKFVVTDNADVLTINDICKRLSIDPKRVYLMPAGTTPEEIREGLRFLWPLCLTYGYRLSNRLHVQVFNNKTGI